MTPDLPDFSTWTDRQLDSQREHLASLLIIAAGQGDPWKPKMRAELKAVRAEIAKRAATEAGKEDR